MIRSLEDVRKERGYTQEQMAAMLEVAVSTYNQYENGARGVPKDIAEKASDILGVKLREIFSPTKFTVSK